MSTDVKSDKNWKPTTIKIDLKSIGAASLALISGFTMSGGIMLVAGMLQGDVTSFPHYLYNKNFTASLFFGASILTWAGINYTEMRKLFDQKPTKLERLSGRVNSANMVFSIQDKSYEANVLNQVVSEHIEQQLIESRNALKGATAYLDSKQNTLASKINYGMRRIPGFKTINDYLTGRSQLQQRVSYLSELNSNQ
ncbi:MAG: hypothetical protein VXW87_03580, partial [Pseudomonadota bacterium]|nr:hypothetical protein [Pseudomonadota bacterium]